MSKLLALIAILTIIGPAAAETSATSNGQVHQVTLNFANLHQVTCTVTYPQSELRAVGTQVVPGRVTDFVCWIIGKKKHNIQLIDKEITADRMTIPTKDFGDIAMTFDVSRRSMAIDIPPEQLKTFLEYLEK